MEEPPAKRARRTDSAAVWDKHDSSNRSTASPRSPRPHATNRDGRPRGHDESRNGGYSGRREDERRRRSRSPRDRHDRGERGYRVKDRERDQDRDKAKDSSGRRDKERSRSRDRHEPSQDYRTKRKRDRSRSPYRDGEASTTTRQRSPHRSRVKQEERAPKVESKNVIPKVNGESADQKMVDGDDIAALVSKVMGFSSFKTTQNTKVPGNQIYGVRKEKKTEYRQYMNRVGGFNRPLSPG